MLSRGRLVGWLGKCGGWRGRHPIRWQVRGAVARSGSGECAALAAGRGGDRAGASAGHIKISWWGLGISNTINQLDIINGRVDNASKEQYRI